MRLTSSVSVVYISSLASIPALTVGAEAVIFGVQSNMSKLPTSAVSKFTLASATPSCGILATTSVEMVAEPQAFMIQNPALSLNANPMSIIFFDLPS